MIDLSVMRWHIKQVPTPTWEEIGEVFGVTGQYVSFLAKKHNIAKPDAQSAKMRQQRLDWVAANETCECGAKKSLGVERCQKCWGVSCRKDDRARDTHGYVRTPRYDQPNGRIYEHQVVAEKMLGRPLRREEEVHHINDIRDDNRPENLMVVTRRKHMILDGRIVE